MSELINPLGIFDAGIGSFGIVETVKKYYPKQDIIWFADRASFPLGQKTPDQLFDVGTKSIEFLSSQGSTKIIVAANVLTMLVMDRLQEAFPELDLYGVTPPAQKAAEHGDFCILGVKAMVEDPKLKEFVSSQIPSSVRACFANASPLIDELVETGIFVTDPDKTKLRVIEYMRALSFEQRDVSAYTLSSTHLPWLRFAFKNACPNKVFLDTAEELVLQMDLPNDGSGVVKALTSENIELSMTQSELQKMLRLIGHGEIKTSLVEP